MTERADRPTLGRDPILQELTAGWRASAEGPHMLLLDGERGSGRQTLTGTFHQKLMEGDERPCMVRIAFDEADDGVKTLMRVFGAFVASLGRGAGFETSPADLLETASQTAGDERIGQWLKALSDNMREMKVQSGPGDFRIQLPRDNPYLALLYAIDVLAPRTRWLIELSELGTCTSPAFWVFLTALVGRANSRNWKMLFLASAGPNLYGENPESADRAGPRSFLSALFAEAQPVAVGPLGSDEVAEFVSDCYRPNSFPADFVDRLGELCAGHPETLHEVLDLLEEDETITWDEDGYKLSSLEDLDLEILVPIPVEDEEDEEGEEGEEGEASDTPDHEETLTLERVLHVAALEGMVFSAGAVRTVLGMDEDTVNDALDAMPHLVEEGSYHEGLGTWTYRFRRRLYQRWYRDNPPEGWANKSTEIGRALGRVMMQAYAPAAFEYICRSARVLTEAGESKGAQHLLGMAMGSERIELADFALEVIERFDDSLWPPQLERFLHTNLADRFVSGAPPDEATKRIEGLQAWAEAAEDQDGLAYARLLACRLKIRQGELDAARKEAEAALAAFEAAGSTTRAGETLNQLAMLCLNQNDPKGAEQWVKRAQKATNIPPVKAHSQYILGLLLKGKRQIPQALACFAGATKLAGEGGQLGLALEAMLNQAECATMLGRSKELVPMLERALEMSRALRSPPRERAAARLLCRAQGELGQAAAAYEMALHALELTRQIEPGGREAVDLYHCGLFGILAEEREAGLDFLNSARAACEKEQNPALLAEVLFNLGQVKISVEDWQGARGALEQSLSIARQNKERARELRILEALGIALSGLGEHRAAVEHFQEAADKAVGPEAKDFRKGLRKRIAQEQSRANGQA